MDDRVFDRLTRAIGTPGSRRAALGALLAAIPIVVGNDATAERRNQRTRKHRRLDKGKRKRKENERASAQDEPCWRAGACIVRKGSNVSQCDLAGYTAPDPLDCTRCNLSRANLRGADLTGVNFTRANLSGACLVDADFTGATFTNSTNLYNAIFCNTIMPDGSVNNSGCGSGTACCPIGCRSSADCGGGQVCCNGACGECCEDADCEPTGEVCNSDLQCRCGDGSACSVPGEVCDGGICHNPYGCTVELDNCDPNVPEEAPCPLNPGNEFGKNFCISANGGHFCAESFNCAAPCPDEACTRNGDICAMLDGPNNHCCGLPNEGPRPGCIGLAAPPCPGDQRRCGLARADDVCCPNGQVCCGFGSRTCCGPNEVCQGTGRDSFCAPA